MHFRLKGFENCSCKANWFIKVCFFFLFSDYFLLGEEIRVCFYAFSSKGFRELFM